MDVMFADPFGSCMTDVSSIGFAKTDTVFRGTIYITSSAHGFVSTS